MAMTRVSPSAITSRQCPKQERVRGEMWPRLTGACFSLSMVAAILGAQAAFAQTSYPCVNDAPDPYQRGASFASLPDGRAWGSTAV
jgi:hypothetical protein